MKLSIAIPASLVSDVPHLREKTSRLGALGRALAIFRVNELIIYPDRFGQNQQYEADLISTILSYMETPQYLRKRLFPKMQILRYAGILPPLRTPHHPLTKKILDLKNGEFREGVVIEVGKENLVDIGVEHPISLNEGGVFLGKRVTVKIFKNKSKIKIKRVKKTNIDCRYWGYSVNVSNYTLGKILKQKTLDLVVLTSRYGKPLTEIIGELRHRMQRASKMLIAFGASKQGLREILQYDDLKLKDVVGFVINTIPKQGTETVRTEEAVFATLALINIRV